jgi:hypothetical protein
MKVKDCFLNLGQLQLNNGSNIRFGKTGGWVITLCINNTHLCMLSLERKTFRLLVCLVEYRLI